MRLLKQMDRLYFCPHCHAPVLVNPKEMNCRIFRHGAHKHTYQQIHPHAPQSECDRLVREDVIIGCGKPFQILLNDTVVKCEYIYDLVFCLLLSDAV